MQSSPEKYNQGMIHALTFMVREEGVGVLLAGLGPTVIGYAVEGAMKFGVYEVSKPFVKKIISNTNLAFIVASVVAGAVAAVLLCPMEGVRIRVVTDDSYKNMSTLSSLMKLVQEEGFGVLFGGLYAMLAKQVPYTMGKQVSFDLVAGLLYTLLASFDKVQIKWVVSFLAAFIASIFACITSQPGDMILTATYKGATDQGFVDIIRNIYRKSGLNGFFTGTGARLVHVCSIITTQLMIYDVVKQALGLPATGSH